MTERHEPPDTMGILASGPVIHGLPLPAISGHSNARDATFGMTLKGVAFTSLVGGNRTKRYLCIADTRAFRRCKHDLLREWPSAARSNWRIRPRAA